MDGAVRKGEKGSSVVFASKLTRSETDAETGEESERDIPFLKGYTVFNVEQIDGLPDHFHAPAAPRLDPVQRIAPCGRFLCGDRRERPARRQSGLLQR